MNIMLCLHDIAVLELFEMPFQQRRELQRSHEADTTALSQIVSNSAQAFKALNHLFELLTDNVLKLKVTQSIQDIVTDLFRRD